MIGGVSWGRGGGTFHGGGGMSKFLASGEGLPPSPSRENPVVSPQESVKNFKLIWLSHLA